MANKYDPPQMTRCAENIEEELRKFRTAKDNVNSAMSTIREEAFNDDTGRRYVQMYLGEAKPTMEELDRTLSDFVSLMKICAQKFANAIDNGNSYLSS